MKTFVKLFCVFSIIGVLIGINSCTHYKANLDNAEDQISEISRENNSAAKIASERTARQLLVTESFLKQTNYFESIVSLTLAKEANDLTGSFLNRNENLLGKPIEDQTEIINALLSENAKIKQLAQALQDKKQKEETNLKQKEKNNQAKLIEYGVKEEQDRNSNIVKRIWYWSVGSFGVLGAIAFIIFCPTIAIPLLGRLVGLIIESVPKIASFVGLVTKNAMTTVIKGVGTVRTELKRIKEENPSKTYTAKEILAMLDDELLKATDQKDRVIIEAIRKDLKV